MNDISDLEYVDDRETGHTYVDFTLRTEEVELPINVKNAGTRFRKAEGLVGLDPDDCIPIPVYKAVNALDESPNLLYAVSVDYDLVDELDQVLPSLFTREEEIVWRLLNAKKGTYTKKAEDAFVHSVVSKHWDTIRETVADCPFRVISARKSVKVMNDKPKRTPGVGMPAWGNRASAEVNVHVSIAEDTTLWDEVDRRIRDGGLEEIEEAVNRKVKRWVYDPEI